MKVGVKVFSAGYCTQLESMVIKGGRYKNVKIPALFALIEHPTKGHILFDTGYSSHFYEATKTFPYKLHAWLIPVFCKPEEGPAQQLQAQGIDPRSIESIILSHFHSDHVAGLKDFPDAQFIYFENAYDAVKGKTGFDAVRRGYLPDLLPSDLEQRSSVVGDNSVIQLDDDYRPFEQGYDLLGDGSLVAVELPGHAHGQMGIFLQDEQGQHVFLAADACWYSQAYRELRYPHPLANLVQADGKAYKETLKKLHQLHKHRPDLLIVPSHCPEMQERFAIKDFR